MLIVDDEENLIELLKMNFGKDYNILVAYNGMDAIVFTKTELPDIILLDLMLPDIDGEEVCKLIRSNTQTKNIPIIILSAKSSQSDKIYGLTIGADDYITKPFSLEELSIRIKNVLKRYKNNLSNSNVISSIGYSNIFLNDENNSIVEDNKEIELTLTEYKIFKILYSNLGFITKRTLLLKELGLDEQSLDSRVLDVHILNIRKKLKKNNFNIYIETARGIGYRLK